MPSGAAAASFPPMAIMNGWVMCRARKFRYFIHRPDHGLFAFAGLWEHWLGADGSELETAAIITTEPNAVIAQIYTRMPAVIQPENYAAVAGCQEC